MHDINVDSERKIYKCESFVKFSQIGNGLSYIGCTMNIGDQNRKEGKSCE